MVERHAGLDEHAGAPAMREAGFAFPVDELHRVDDELIGVGGERDPFGSFKSVAALTSEAIIKPFQSAMILSSRPGRTRFSRASKSLCRIGASLASSSAVGRFDSSRFRIVTISSCGCSANCRSRGVCRICRRSSRLPGRGGRRAPPRSKHRICLRRLRCRRQGSRRKPPSKLVISRVSQPTVSLARVRKRSSPNSSVAKR